MFRQLRPKELIHEKGNLSISTLRSLRSILPSSCVWTALKAKGEFLSRDKTLAALDEFFPAPEDGGVDGEAASSYPETIEANMDNELVMESLGGLISFVRSTLRHPSAINLLSGLHRYLRQLNLDKDLLSQKNFDVYAPIREGQNLILDGQTLGT